jgi:hypothetical protein
MEKKVTELVRYENVINGLLDSLKASEMRFGWAMDELKKYRIENENLTAELKEFRAMFGHESTDRDC